jgi:hypothetical protein
MLARMRNAKMKVIGLAVLAGSLAACGGNSGAPGPQVAAIPASSGSAHSSAPAASGAVDRTFPLGATQDEIDRLYAAYYACWTQHGVPSTAAGNMAASPLLTYKLHPKKYQAAVDACADKEPVNPPELDPQQNPEFADDLRTELNCENSHGLTMQIRDDSIWVTPETKANLDKANSDAGREIQRQCEISAFTKK